MARLQGKTTIITGAASGLGRVAAQMFALEGSRVVVADVVDGNETVDEINRLGGQAAFVQCDVTNEES
jgi:NAD(P)-dependent dehydrogenase (short-subunit alcohol dehydrogenase family)